jgi:hypothetical protein
MGTHIADPGLPPHLPFVLRRRRPSAGALGEVTARDGFLASLCEFAVAPCDGPGGAAGPDGQAAPSLQAAGAVLTAALSQTSRAGAGGGGAPGGGDGGGSGSGAAGGGPAPALGIKNIHSLRTLFNVSHRLADSLGHAWVFVVEVLFALERALPPAGGQGSGKVRPRGRGRVGGRARMPLRQYGCRSLLCQGLTTCWRAMPHPPPAAPAARRRRARRCSRPPSRPPTRASC